MRTVQRQEQRQRQRIFNVLFHLEDGTLPPDRWDENAELAAMVYLCVQHPPAAAISRLNAAIHRYNEINRALRLPQLAFDRLRGTCRIRAISRLISQLPRCMHIGEIHACVLATGRAVIDGETGADEDSLPVRPKAAFSYVGAQSAFGASHTKN